MVDEDFRRQIAGEKAGAAIKFTDIDGIGPATAKKIKNAGQTRRSIQAPRDVADMSADELSDKAGISRDRARKAISGGGGNPGVSKRNTTGSVSAAGITYPVGEFRVEAGDQDKARARNDTFSRSKEAIRQDDQKRAPITTDVERWKNNKSGLDFPGVDTPTQDPKVLPKDLKQKQQPRTTEPDAQSQAAQTRQEPQELPTRSMFAPEPFGAELANRDVSLSPDEALNGTGAVATNALGGNFGNEGERAPTNEPEAPSNTALRRQQRKQGKGLKSGDTGAGDIAFIYQNEGKETGMSLAEFRRQTKRKKRQMGGAADDFAAARMVAEDNKPKQQESQSNDRVTVDVPDQTLATLRTGLNERTDDYFDNFEPENQDRLTSIKERISIGEPLELSPGEFQDAKRILKDERDRAEDRAERMDRNIFGDTSEQAGRANAALQGLISNPPGF